MDVDQKWKELYGDISEESVYEENPSSPCEFQEWQRHVPPVSRRDQVELEESCYLFLSKTMNTLQQLFLFEGNLMICEQLMTCLLL